jgi:hypothetical protein
MGANTLSRRWAKARNILPTVEQKLLHRNMLSSNERPGCRWTRLSTPEHEQETMWLTENGICKWLAFWRGSA